jgi:ZIP family zinc transporter
MVLGVSHGLFFAVGIASHSLGLASDVASTSECVSSSLGAVEEQETVEADGLRVELLQKQTQYRTNIYHHHKKGNLSSPNNAANSDTSGRTPSSTEVADVLRNKVAALQNFEPKRASSNQKGDKVKIGLLQGQAGTQMTWNVTLGVLAIPAIFLLVSSFSCSICRISQLARGAMQHFASGVVLSAMTVELVPVILDPAAPALAVFAGFFLGIAFFASLQKMLDHRHAYAFSNEDLSVEPKSVLHGGGEAAVPWATIGPTLADFMSDGVLAGLSFAAGAKAGVIIALAIALEMASVGGTVFACLKSRKVATGNSIGVMCFLAASLYGTGVLALMYATDLYGTAMFYLLLSFACSACLWLMIGDLVQVAEAAEDQKWLVTILFFVGFFGPIAFEKLLQ